MHALAHRLIGLLAVLFAAPAFGQAWPTKPIRMIVNFAAGGSTDVIARSMAPKLLNYGSAGAGTLQHVAAEMLMRAAKIDVTHVPYKGSQAVLVDLLGGQVDFTFDLGAAIPHIKNEKVRLLAVPGGTRSPLFPDTPTMTEAGTNVVIEWRSGVYAPAATPRDIIVRLNREIGRIMQTTDARAVLAPMAAEAAAPMTPEEFAAQQQRARERFGALVREANIRLN